jgi:hypothetical protein
MARFTGYGQIGMPTAYRMGGGTIGGPNVWNFSSGRPQLSQAARQAGVIGLPAGALSRQEIRNRKDVQMAMMSGSPYVEFPTMFKLNQQGKYINPLTGESMGTTAINYSAGGWSGAKGEEMASGGGYSPNVQAMRAAQGRNPYGPESGGYKESGGPQPAQPTAQPEPRKAPDGYMYNQFGYLEKDYSKEGFKKNEYGYWVEDPEAKKKISREAVRSVPFGKRVEEEEAAAQRESIFGPYGAPRLTGQGVSSIRFPYAGY